MDAEHNHQYQQHTALRFTPIEDSSADTFLISFARICHLEGCTHTEAMTFGPVLLVDLNQHLMTCPACLRVMPPPVSDDPDYVPACLVCGHQFTEVHA